MVGQVVTGLGLCALLLLASACGDDSAAGAGSMGGGAGGDDTRAVGIEVLLNDDLSMFDTTNTCSFSSDGENTALVAAAITFGGGAESFSLTFVFPDEQDFDGLEGTGTVTDLDAAITGLFNFAELDEGVMRHVTPDETVDCSVDFVFLREVALPTTGTRPRYRIEFACPALAYVDLDGTTGVGDGTYNDFDGNFECLLSQTIAP